MMIQPSVLPKTLSRFLAAKERVRVAMHGEALTGIEDLDEQSTLASKPLEQVPAQPAVGVAVDEVAEAFGLDRHGHTGVTRNIGTEHRLWQPRQRADPVLRPA